MKEALLNAIYRGNLEVTFEQMQDTRESLLKGRRDDLCERRRSQKPYSDRKVRVKVMIDTERIEIVVADEGPGFDLATARSSNGNGSIDPQTGRGLVLMRSFMDEVRFNDRGNEVTLVKHRENGA